VFVCPRNRECSYHDVAHVQPGSRLEMHLDYSIHPITGKERRVNLIIYMNKDWKEEWGGELNLWEGTPQEMTK
jgi:Rps23 Pro-64 3,4-dihydroxylase Tpa1-like proline 4-hydroxylase